MSLPTRTHEIHVATVPKNGAEEVRVSLSSYLGHACLDVRTFADAGDRDERQATRKGVTLKLSRLNELIAALQRAREEAVRLGLLGEMP